MSTHPRAATPSRKAKKIVQKDRPLPFQRGITPKVFKRKGSSIFQAKYVGTDGAMKRHSTGTRSKPAAEEWLRLMQIRVAHGAPNTPPPKRARCCSPRSRTF